MALDVRAATIAAAFVLALIVITCFALPQAAVGLAYPVLLLCLLIVAAAGRALIGFRAGQSAPTRLGAPTYAAMVAVAAVLPYLQSLGVGFLSDDFGIAATMRRLTTAWQAASTNPLPIFFRPAFALAWWGWQHVSTSPAAYHALSLALHAAISVLVFLVGLRLIRAPHAAAAGAALFALHPLHVEPVVWSSCLADLLCAFFALLSLLLLEVHLAAAGRWRRALSLAAAVGAFLMALFSKEAAAALPGFVVLRVWLLGERPRLRRTIVAGAAYAAALAVYLALRLASLGGVGGYRLFVAPTAILPLAPASHIAAFLFPVHGDLLGGPGLAAAVAAAVMALGALWWVRGLPGVAGGRLWLWLGFVFVMSLPVWLLPAGTRTLENSRLAYLPTMGLAWLFADLVAGRGAGWRRSSAAVAATLAVAAGLTAWYVQPWRQAGALAARVVAEGARVVGALPESVEQPTVYFQGLPETYHGAQVFRNCYSVALGEHLTRPAAVHVVAHGAGAEITPQVMAMSTLLPGEYVVAWQKAAKRMEVVRSGEREGASASLEVSP